MRHVTMFLVTLIAVAVAMPAPAGAQAAAQAAPTARATIDSGMSKAQVIERLGRPSVERTRGVHTYLFYANGQEQRVGMNDVVILREDRVVDAILRAPSRAYSGTSSSPRAIPPEEAAKGAPSRSGASIPRT